jgi:hypothetical protein
MRLLKVLSIIGSVFFGIQTFAQSNIPSYVPSNGLVGYWPFNGNANDESGNGNDGVVHLFYLLVMFTFINIECYETNLEKTS